MYAGSVLLFGPGHKVYWVEYGYVLAIASILGIIFSALSPRMSKITCGF
ncbi:MAG: hypothetical protein ACD_46C00632G0003 [uncultured bacterium]|nr:MAG: hypothetical protein ACD_46C00632G0003 [uncultured bacterium]